MDDVATESIFSRMVRNPRTAQAVLVLSLLATIVATWFAYRAVTERAVERFSFHARNIEAEIGRRMNHYELALRGGVGLFAASESVERSQWQRYVAALDLQRQFPGILGIGYAQAVAGTGLAGHLRATRAKGLPDYRLYPPGERPLHAAIVYLEPLDWRNRRAIGYDMYAEPVRREALDRARDTGMSAVSGIVTLVQETGREVQKGFLLYLPVYRNGAPTATVEQRRAALAGFVYAPFRIDDLMAAIFPETEAAVDFELFDGARTGAASLLFSREDAAAHPPGAVGGAFALERTMGLVVGGRDWTIYSHARPDFIPLADRMQPWIVLGGCVVADLLLFLLIVALSQRRRKAMVLANEMTTALRLSRSQLQSVLDNFPFRIWLKDLDGRFVAANRAFAEDCGLASSVELIGKQDRDIWPQEVAAAQVARDRQVIQTLGKLTSEEAIPAADGEKWLEIFNAPVVGPDARPLGVAGYARDITERKRADLALEKLVAVRTAELQRAAAAMARDVAERRQREEELARLNRTLTALSHSNEAFLRLGTEREYLAAICRIVVEDCGYAMVWIGYAEDDAVRSVRAVVSSGFETDYIDSLNVSWGDNELGQGPTGKAIRTGQPCLCHNIHTDPNFAPWREQAVKRGYASSLALPLCTEGRSLGAISVYSSAAEAFSDNEVQLLQQLADDLAYGIATLRLRDAHRQSEQALRESEERMQLALSTSHSFVFEWEVATDRVQRTDGAGPILGLAGELATRDTGARFLGCVLTEDLGRFQRVLQDLSPTADTYRCEYRLQRSDDTLVNLEESARGFFDGDGKLLRLVGATTDITERKRAEQRLRRLAEVVERIAAVRDASELTRIVVGAARELTDADGATFVLMEAGRCHYVDEDAIGPLWKGQSFPLDDCVSGWAMLHAQGVAIADVASDPRIPQEAYRRTFVQSLSMIPIGIYQPVGALGCYWANRHTASEEEIALQRALADAAAV
ncbi:MAG: CHASE domain-containing protein, partial [Rhodocyclales bacterium]|nr:CHASE domain-containing protein [Rhodocyclales bacterium]